MMKTHKISTKAAIKFLYLILFLPVLSCDLGVDPIDPEPDPTISVNAGADQVVGLKESVTITGFGSASNGSVVTFEWEILSKPSSSNLSLSNTSESSISFVPDLLGEYSFGLNVSTQDGISASDDVKVSVEKIPIALSGTLNENLVLENIYDEPDVPDYKISSTYNVSAQLTIKPDVRIVFEQDAALGINVDGSLIARGEENKPIVLTGVQQTPGFWKGIFFRSNNPDNQIEFLTIEYGGSSGFVGASKAANITLEDDSILKMSNCISQESGGYGLILNRIESTLIDFSANIFTKNTSPVLCLIQHFQFFDIESDYSGNANDYIDSNESFNDVTSDATWQALNVPYRTSKGIEKIQADITIMPGCEFVAKSGGGLQVSEEGSLSAIGESNNRIIFRGEEDVPGYWRGLRFTSNTNKNKLDYIEISNGGYDGFDAAHYKSNIIVSQSARLAITNSISKKSAEFGFFVRDEETILTEFSKNVFTENVTPVRAKVNHFHFFDSESDFTGNTNDYIYAFESYDAPAGEMIWQKLNVPYRLSNSYESIDGNVIINPGVEIISAPDGGIQISESGSLTAIGTPSEMIIIRAEEDIKGFWRGVQIKSQNLQNKLSYVSISGGGSEGFDSGHRKSNLEVVGTLDLSFSNISRSTGYGVRVRKDADITLLENVFSENDDGDIHYDE